MGLVDDMLQRYQEMDEIDRKNFWIVVVGIIVVILLIIQLSGTFGVLGGFFGQGARYVNETMAGAQGMSGTGG